MQIKIKAVYFLSGILALSLALGFSLLTHEEQVYATKDADTGYVTDEILVTFKKDKVDLNSKKGTIKRMGVGLFGGVDEKKQIKSENIAVYSIDDGSSVQEKINELEDDDAVESVQPNFIYELASISLDDASYNLQYTHENRGQMINHVVGTSDAEINTVEAWGKYDGSEDEIVVAVIDTGVDYTHPDLINSMWDGSSCVDGSGIEISGGCTHGYDVGSDDADPMPFMHQWESHGTYVAGAIAAADNAIGIIGVNPNVKVMAIKTSALTPDGMDVTSVTTASMVNGINFAKQNNADLITLAVARVGSDGKTGSDYDANLKNTIESFDGLVITAAGNHAKNIDSTSYYPASFDSSNIISVTATDQNDELAYFSSWGTTHVDVAAPGMDIYGTSLDNIKKEEDVQNAIVPSLPAGITSGSGSFGTVDLAGSGEKVFVGDTNQSPYTDGHTSKIESGDIDFSGISEDTELFLDMWVYCDTEYVSGDDTMTLSFSAQGGEISGIPSIPAKGLEVTAVFDEVMIGNMTGQTTENTDAGGGYGYHFREMIIVGDSYKKTDFRWALEWQSDADNNNHAGCYVDDLRFKTLESGSNTGYGYFRGTSIAAGHVAGLTALATSFRTDLPKEDIKDAVLNQGDSLASLSGKIGTGKRINAFNTINSIIPPMTHFTITGNDVQVAGAEQEVTITAVNIVGRTHKSYTGTHSIIFSGANNSQTSVVPSCKDVSFGASTELDFTEGVATCQMKLYKKEDIQIEVSDGTHNSEEEDSYDLNVNVSAADANAGNTNIDVTPSPAVPGRNVDVVVTAKDQYLNQREGDDDVIIVNITGANTETPTVTDNSDGTHSASYTPANGGDDNITATVNSENVGSDSDGTSDGTFNLVVQEPEMKYFIITADSAIAEAGVETLVTVTAKDTMDEVHTEYTGDKTIIFSGANNASSGTKPICKDKDGVGIEFGTATTITFTDGIGTCSMALYKKETAVINVLEDNVDPSPDYDSAGYSLNMNVSAAAVSSNYTNINVNPDPATEDVDVKVTVTAKDMYKNDLSSGGDVVKVVVSGSNSKTMSTTDSGNGTYITRYAPENSGADKITATVNGDNVSSDEDGDDDGEYNLSISAGPPPPPPTFDFSELEIKFDDDYVSGRHRALKDEVKFKFKDTEGVKYYMASTYDEFTFEDWGSISDSPKLDIDSWNQEEGEKQKFYFKFKSDNGVESEIFSKYVIYDPKVSREIKQSASKVNRGDILVQSGKRFKKNKDVNLYFSRPGGGYYPPTMVRTNKEGKFEVHYRVNKASGKYTWYAQQISTGRKSEVKEYKIR